MKQTIDLHTSWQFTWTQHEGDIDRPPDKFLVPFRQADVPGDAHLDLQREGMLPDLFVGRNLDHARWMEDKDWWYRNTFEAPQRTDESRVLLVFHGLDTYGTVWLNGQELGRTDNMHRRYEFDVTDALAASGANELVVRLASPRYMIPFDPQHRPVFWSPERVFCRKAAMSFGWDIAPRLMTVGIWRPVQLVVVDTARITDVFVRLAHRDEASATVTVEVTVDRTDKDDRLSILGQVHAAPFEAALEPGQTVATATVTIPDAPLWWPIGYGQPNLIDAAVVLQEGTQSLDNCKFKTGLRTVELVQEAQPSGATSFKFRVNGQDMFVTGLNWTPLDAILARITPGRITRTLEALAGIGCNMLRVWGGGIYEPHHFYNECDRLGIMIWQDFMMGCAWYPQTDAMAAAIEAEAQQVVRDLRPHPCIALWAGDNECDAFAPTLAARNRLTRQVLAGVCSQLDPQTPYLPSSPYSPRSADPQDQREGDMHCYAHGEDYRQSDMWDLRPRFMSEFGHLSLPGMETIRRYLPPGTEWPLDGDMWRYHGSDTIGTGRFRWTDRILRSLAACGRPTPRTIDEAVTASQELQSEAMIALIERYSSDPEFDGFLIWNVADCWPQMSDSVIDYLGQPKRIFERLGRLFADLRQQRGAPGDQNRRLSGKRDE